MEEGDEVDELVVRYVSLEEDGDAAAEVAETDTQTGRVETDTQATAETAEQTGRVETDTQATTETGAEGRTTEGADALDDATEQEDIYATVDKDRGYTSEDDSIRIYPDETPEAREERLARNARNVKSDPLLGQDLPPADEPAPPPPLQTEDSLVSTEGERLVAEKPAANSQARAVKTDYESVEDLDFDLPQRSSAELSDTDVRVAETDVRGTEGAAEGSEVAESRQVVTRKEALANQSNQKTGVFRKKLVVREVTIEDTRFYETTAGELLSADGKEGLKIVGSTDGRFTNLDSRLGAQLSSLADDVGNAADDTVDTTSVSGTLDADTSSPQTQTTAETGVEGRTSEVAESREVVTRKEAFANQQNAKESGGLFGRKKLVVREVETEGGRFYETTSGQLLSTDSKTGLQVVSNNDVQFSELDYSRLEPAARYAQADQVRLQMLGMPPPGIEPPPLPSEVTQVSSVSAEVTQVSSATAELTPVSSATAEVTQVSSASAELGDSVGNTVDDVGNAAETTGGSGSVEDLTRGVEVDSPPQGTSELAETNPPPQTQATAEVAETDTLPGRVETDASTQATAETAEQTGRVETDTQATTETGAEGRTAEVAEAGEQPTTSSTGEEITEGVEEGDEVDELVVRYVSLEEDGDAAAEVAEQTGRVETDASTQATTETGAEGRTAEVAEAGEQPTTSSTGEEITEGVEEGDEVDELVVRYVSLEEDGDAAAEVAEQTGRVETDASTQATTETAEQTGRVETDTQATAETAEQTGRVETDTQTTTETAEQTGRVETDTQATTEAAEQTGRVETDTQATAETAEQTGRVETDTQATAETAEQTGRVETDTQATTETGAEGEGNFSGMEFTISEPETAYANAQTAGGLSEDGALIVRETKVGPYYQTVNDELILISEVEAQGLKVEVRATTDPIFDNTADYDGLMADPFEVVADANMANLDSSDLRWGDGYESSKWEFSETVEGQQPPPDVDDFEATFLERPKLEDHLRVRNKMDVAIGDDGGRFIYGVQVGDTVILPSGQTIPVEEFESVLAYYNAKPYSILTASDVAADGHIVVGFDDVDKLYIQGTGVEVSPEFVDNFQALSGTEAELIEANPQLIAANKAAQVLGNSAADTQEYLDDEIIRGAREAYELAKNGGGVNEDGALIVAEDVEGYYRTAGDELVKISDVEAEGIKVEIRSGEDRIFEVDELPYLQPDKNLDLAYNANGEPEGVFVMRVEAQVKGKPRIEFITPSGQSIPAEDAQAFLADNNTRFEWLFDIDDVDDDGVLLLDMNDVGELRLRSSRVRVTQEFVSQYKLGQITNEFGELEMATVDIRVSEFSGDDFSTAASRAQAWSEPVADDLGRHPLQQIVDANEAYADALKRGGVNEDGALIVRRRGLDQYITVNDDIVLKADVHANNIELDLRLYNDEVFKIDEFPYLQPDERLDVMYIDGKKTIIGLELGKNSDATANATINVAESGGPTQVVREVALPGGNTIPADDIDAFVARHDATFQPLNIADEFDERGILVLELDEAGALHLQKSGLEVSDEFVQQFQRWGVQVEITGGEQAGAADGFAGTPVSGLDEAATALDDGQPPPVPPRPGEAAEAATALDDGRPPPVPPRNVEAAAEAAEQAPPTQATAGVAEVAEADTVPQTQATAETGAEGAAEGRPAEVTEVAESREVVTREQAVANQDNAKQTRWFRKKLVVREIEIEGNKFYETTGGELLSADSDKGLRIVSNSDGRFAALDARLGAQVSSVADDVGNAAGDTTDATGVTGQTGRTAEGVGAEGAGEAVEQQPAQQPVQTAAAEKYETSQWQFGDQQTGQESLPPSLEGEFKVTDLERPDSLEVDLYITNELDYAMSKNGKMYIYGAMVEDAVVLRSGQTIPADQLDTVWAYYDAKPASIVTASDVDAGGNLLIVNEGGRFYFQGSGTEVTQEFINNFQALGGKVIVDDTAAAAGGATAIGDAGVAGNQVLAGLDDVADQPPAVPPKPEAAAESVESSTASSSASSVESSVESIEQSSTAQRQMLADLGIQFDETGGEQTPPSLPPKPETTVEGSEGIANALDDTSGAGEQPPSLPPKPETTVEVAGEAIEQQPALSSTGEEITEGAEGRTAEVAEAGEQPPSLPPKPGETVEVAGEAIEQQPAQQPALSSTGEEITEGAEGRTAEVAEAGEQPPSLPPKPGETVEVAGEAIEQQPAQQPALSSTGEEITEGAEGRTAEVAEAGEQPPSLPPKPGEAAEVAGEAQQPALSSTGEEITEGVEEGDEVDELVVRYVSLEEDGDAAAEVAEQTGRVETDTQATAETAEQTGRVETDTQATTETVEQTGRVETDASSQPTSETGAEGRTAEVAEAGEQPTASSTGEEITEGVEEGDEVDELVVRYVSLEEDGDAAAEVAETDTLPGRVETDTQATAETAEQTGRVETDTQATTETGAEGRTVEGADDLDDADDYLEDVEQFRRPDPEATTEQPPAVPPRPGEGDPPPVPPKDVDATAEVAETDTLPGRVETDTQATAETAEQTGRVETDTQATTETAEQTGRVETDTQATTETAEQTGRVETDTQATAETAEQTGRVETDTQATAETAEQTGRVETDTQATAETAEQTGRVETDTQATAETAEQTGRVETDTQATAETAEQTGRVETDTQATAETAEQTGRVETDTQATAETAEQTGRVETDTQATAETAEQTGRVETDTQATAETAEQTGRVETDTQATAETAEQTGRVETDTQGTAETAEQTGRVETDTQATAETAEQTGRVETDTQATAETAEQTGRVETDTQATTETGAEGEGNFSGMEFTISEPETAYANAQTAGGLSEDGALIVRETKVGPYYQTVNDELILISEVEAQGLKVEVRATTDPIFDNTADYDGLMADPFEVVADANMANLDSSDLRWGDGYESSQWEFSETVEGQQPPPDVDDFEVTPLKKPEFLEDHLYLQNDTFDVVEVQGQKYLYGAQVGDHIVLSSGQTIPADQIESVWAYYDVKPFSIIDAGDLDINGHLLIVYDEAGIPYFRGSDFEVTQEFVDTFQRLGGTVEFGEGSGAAATQAVGNTADNAVGQYVKSAQEAYEFAQNTGGVNEDGALIVGRPSQDYYRTVNNELILISDVEAEGIRVEVRDLRDKIFSVDETPFIQPDKRIDFVYGVPGQPKGIIAMQVAAEVDGQLRVEFILPSGQTVPVEDAQAFLESHNTKFELLYNANDFDDNNVLLLDMNDVGELRLRHSRVEVSDEFLYQYKRWGRAVDIRGSEFSGNDITTPLSQAQGFGSIEEGAVALGRHGGQEVDAMTAYNTALIGGEGVNENGALIVRPRGRHHYFTINDDVVSKTDLAVNNIEVDIRVKDDKVFRFSDLHYLQPDQNLDIVSTDGGRAIIGLDGGKEVVLPGGSTIPTSEIDAFVAQHDATFQPINIADDIRVERINDKEVVTLLVNTDDAGNLHLRNSGVEVSDEFVRHFERWGMNAEISGGEGQALGGAADGFAGGALDDTVAALDDVVEGQPPALPPKPGAVTETAEATAAGGSGAQLDAVAETVEGQPPALPPKPGAVTETAEATAAGGSGAQLDAVAETVEGQPPALPPKPGAVTETAEATAAGGSGAQLDAVAETVEGQPPALPPKPGTVTETAEATAAGASRMMPRLAVDKASPQRRSNPR